MVAIGGRRRRFIRRPAADIEGDSDNAAAISGFAGTEGPRFAGSNRIDYACVNRITLGQGGASTIQHKFISLFGGLLGDGRGRNRRSRAYLLNEGFDLCVCPGVPCFRRGELAPAQAGIGDLWLCSEPALHQLAAGGNRAGGASLISSSPSRRLVSAEHQAGAGLVSATRLGEAPSRSRKRFAGAGSDKP
jgi:hypothetical protein